MTRSATGVVLLSLAGAVLARQDGVSSTWREFLLPEEITVSGVVLDENEKPVAGAWIAHAALPNKDNQTSADGSFRFTTRAPAFVIRQLGYQGAYVKVTQTGPLRIILKPVQDTLPICTNPTTCSSLSQAGGHFCFPKIPGVKVRGHGQDIDYTTLVYSAHGPHGKRYLQHGSGPMWSFGVPEDEDVRSSVEYSERTYQGKRYFVVDARGKTAKGGMWRFLGEMGESAEYEDADPATAALFDKMMDGVCMVPSMDWNFVP